MPRIPTDWPDAFAKYAARSYDNFRAVPKQELAELQKGHKLLGQVTYKGIELRTVVNRGYLLVQGTPLEGTAHDLVEEFVLIANEKHQGVGLPVESQKKLVEASRDSIIDAAENVLEGLTPEYLEARISLARHSKAKVVTTQNEMPANAILRENLGDIIFLSKKIERASLKPVPPELQERFDRTVIRILGTEAYVYEIPHEGQDKQKRVA